MIRSACSIAALSAIMYVSAAAHAEEDAAPAPPTAEDAKAVEGKPLEAHIETERGTIRIELLTDAAPRTVANFKNLADAGFYDGVTFHRVIADFMIQGGDPTATGRGGPGYRFDDEASAMRLEFDRPGLLAMANAGPNTNGSQFFITHEPTPWLNGRHAIFGKVLEGQDVVDAIQRGDEMISVEVVEVEDDREDDQADTDHNG